MAEVPRDQQKKIFCTKQRLLWLMPRQGVREYLSSDLFLHSDHPDRARQSKEEFAAIWQEVSRPNLIEEELSGRSADKRFAVICSAGLGKSTNLKNFEYALCWPGSRQLPFFVPLDENQSTKNSIKWDLPDNAEAFLKETLVRVVGRLSGRESESGRLEHHLKRYRTEGRITLLLDSLDQATGNAKALARDLLTNPLWQRCPIAISGRPEAFYDDWKRVIAEQEQDEIAWRFIRIEPLEERERILLLGEDRYKQLPEEGRELMANPRNIEYVLEADKPKRRFRDKSDRTPYDYTLQDFKTASHLYAGAVEHLVRTGFTCKQARTLGMKPDQMSNGNNPNQIALALDLLSAIAYTMYIWPLLRDARATLKEFRPNVSHIPKSELPDFNRAVKDNLKRAGIERLDGHYDLDGLERDITALAALNNQIKHDLLDRDVGELRWYNRSLQEFFTARWLARFYDEAYDRECLQECCYDGRERPKESLYKPLWGFLIEMPLEVRPRRYEEKWVDAVGVLFETESTRTCEMIYRSWIGMEETQRGLEKIKQWQQEFPKILKSRGAKGKIAREIVNGFRHISAGRCQFGADSPEEAGIAIEVPEFYLHQWPVTNLMYELFDSNHKETRWYGEHPLAKVRGRNGEDYCPVVRVSWFDAWCLARWIDELELKNGTRVVKVVVRLPSEEEWEHACRAGTSTSHWFQDATKLADYAWHSDTAGELGSTKPVGTKEPTGNKLYDMYGNVWEWCESLWEPEASARVLRGGGWSGNARSCRSAYRDGVRAGHPDRLIGFRLAAVSRVVGAKRGGSEPCVGPESKRSGDGGAGAGLAPMPQVF